MAALMPLIIYAGMAIAVVGGGWAFIHSHDNGIRNEQIAKDTVILDRVKKERDDSIGRELQRQAETQACVDKAEIQSTAVNDLAARTKAAQEASRKAIADANAKAAANAGEITKLRALVSATPVRDQTCEATLAKTDAILRSMVKVQGASK